MSHYCIPVKCMACSLHFTIHSDFSVVEAWHAPSIYCPECGVQGQKILWQEEVSDTFIFQHVPGSQLPVEMA